MASATSNAAPPAQPTATSSGLVPAATASSLPNSAVSGIVSQVTSMVLPPRQRTNAAQVPSSAANSTAVADANCTQEANEGDDEEEDEEELDSEYSLRDSDHDSDGESVDAIDKAHERKNRLTEFDKDGEVVWKHRESSFTIARIISSGPCRPSHLYDKASPTELRKYVNERGLPDPYPLGLTLKYFYLLLLDKADEQVTFRFLDLPPEMRNLVYVELLTFDDGCDCHDCSLSKTCHPGILRASKQVYKEAKDILYANNTIYAKFVACTDSTYITGRYTRIHNDEVTGYATKINMLYRGMSAIPDWLHRVQSLHIDIEAHGLGAARTARGFLQGCTLNLASFFLEGHRLKKLHVHLVNHLHLDDEKSRMSAVILYPLRRLSGLVEVTITGSIDEATSNKAIADMQRPSEPTFNTVPHLYKLRDEAWTYMNMVQSLDPRLRYFGRPLPQGAGGGRSHRVQWLLEETEYSYDSDEADTGEFEDSDAEANLRRKMEDLKGCLDKTKLAGFEDKKEKFTDAQNARAALQSEQAWTDVDAGKQAPRPPTHTRKWNSRLLDAEDGYYTDDTW